MYNKRINEASSIFMAEALVIVTLTIVSREVADNLEAETKTIS